MGHFLPGGQLFILWRSLSWRRRRRRNNLALSALIFSQEFLCKSGKMLLLCTVYNSDRGAPLNEYSIVQHKTIRLHSPTLYFWATLRHCLPKSTIISAPKKVPSVGFELPSKERQQVSNNRKPFIHKEESREKW